MTLTISLLRPDDLVALSVEVTNMRLDASDPGQPRLVRDAADQPALLTFRFPPQSIAEWAYFQVTAPVSTPYNPPPTVPPLPQPPSGNDPLPLPGQTGATMSGESRLVFQLPDGVTSLPYSIEGLLDWAGLLPVLPPAADVPPGASQAAGQQPPAIAEPGEAETALELPYRLLIAPNVSAGATPAWLHAIAPVGHAGWTELWHTRLGAQPTGHGAAPAEASAQNPLPVRAVWSPDFVADGPLPADPPPPNPPHRTAMSAADRDQIVILSSGYSGYTLTSQDGTSQAYVPQPVAAEQLFLSALGGWLTSRGAWDYPVTYRYRRIHPIRAVGRGDIVLGDLVTLDLIEWDHNATQGRDHHVRIVYEGFIYPFGHRATLVKVTERTVEAPNGTDGNPSGSPVALLRQRMYIVIRERVKSYLGAAYQFAGREMPLAAQLRVNVAVTPDIDPPGQANTVGSQSFWITINGGNYPLPLVGVDAAEADIDLLAPVIFVSLDENNLTAVQTAYASSDQERQCAVRGRKIAYADPAAGDTILKTSALYFTSELDLSQPAPYLSAPFLPALDHAAVTVPALTALTGQNAAVPIRLYQRYLEQGLDQYAGVFATIAGTAPPVSFSADKSGGFSQPNINLTALSAGKGLVAGNPDDAAANVMRPTDYFGPADAKLFGAIELGNLLAVVAGIANAADSAPEIRTHATPSQRHPTLLTTVINWTPPLADNPPANNTAVVIVFNSNGQASELSLQVRLENHLNGTPPVSTATGKLSNFQLTMSGVIALMIDEITFDSSNGAKSTVALQLAKQHPIQFVGALQFIQTLADILPPGLFGGSGPSITLAPTALKVSYTIGLPPIPCGMFSLENIAIMAGLDLPYLDGNTALEFAFASRNRPFLVTVEIFGGGGFVHLVLDADGIKMVEGSIEFGANFCLDLGVASGAVHAMAGIYFQLAGSSDTLTGFIDIGGEVSVLGILSISMDLNISLSWQHTSSGNVIQGRATLTVSVHVLFFSASVQLSVERSFSAGSGDPDVGQVLDAAAWAQYAESFG